MSHVRTFAEECRAVECVTFTGSTPSAEYAHLAMLADLAYLVRSYVYGAVKAVDVDAEIWIERIVRDRAGYANGVYYGHDGLCLYSVSMPDGRHYHVRAEDRATLRSALRRLFPNATVAR